MCQKCGCSSCSTSKISGTMKKRSKTVTVKITPETMLGVAVGGGATVVANRFLENIEAIANNPQADLIIAAVEGVGGYLLATEFKQPFIQAAGVGMIGAAGLKVVEATGLATSNVNGTPYLPAVKVRRGASTATRRKMAI